MNYNEFLAHIRECAKKIAGEGGKVLIQHIIKNNGFELDGLVIIEAERNISPTIYLNEYYQQYQSGRDIGEIMGEIGRVYEENKNRICFDPVHFNDYEQIRHSIVYKVINYEKNKKLLADIPHKRILDLAVVFYCLIEQEHGMNATALIHNAQMNAWEVTEDQIYQDAVRNTPELLESCIKPMKALLHEIAGGTAVNEESAEGELSDKSEEQNGLTVETNQENGMYVLTNQARVNGAACILYENVLKKFAACMGCDLYILPSSVHEVILLPKLDQYDKAALADMVREVNAEGVAEDEILSENVYEYNRKDGMISL